MVRKMLDLLHKKGKLGGGGRGGGYIHGQMPKNSSVICEGSLTILTFLRLFFLFQGAFFRYLCPCVVTCTLNRCERILDSLE